MKTNNTKLDRIMYKLNIGVMEGMLTADQIRWWGKCRRINSIIGYGGVLIDE